MLNGKVVTQSLASFAAISFVLCVGYGLVGGVGERLFTWPLSTGQ